LTKISAGYVSEAMLSTAIFRAHRYVAVGFQNALLSTGNSRAGEKQSDLIHYSEAVLSDFYRRWVADPESFSDNEFFRVHMHLLGCEDCSSLAKKCEDRADAAQPEMKARGVGGA
jgi:hypothetical protein